MGNCQFDAQCFRLNILALDPASTRAPSRAELSVQRLSPRSAVLSSALLSACSSGFNECDLDPGTSFLKSSNPKPENSWFCIFLAAWNTCIIQIQAAGCLWVHDGQIIFCDCSLSCSLLWLSPAVWVVGWGVDSGHAESPSTQTSVPVLSAANMPGSLCSANTAQHHSYKLQTFSYTRSPSEAGWSVSIPEKWCRYTFEKPISVFS